MAEKVSGNPNVFKEAHERKRGGKVKKKHHEKHEKHEVEGEMARHRMDRPRRARGGAAGSNRNPFSSARHSTSPEKCG